MRHRTSHTCHQKPNSSRETFPLSKKLFLYTPVTSAAVWSSKPASVSPWWSSLFSIVSIAALRWLFCCRSYHTLLSLCALFPGPGKVFRCQSLNVKNEVYVSYEKYCTVCHLLTLLYENSILSPTFLYVLPLSFHFWPYNTFKLTISKYPIFLAYFTSWAVISASGDIAQREGAKNNIT